MKIKIGFILFVAILLFVSIILFTPPFISRTNSIYTKSYTLEKFNTIKNGFTEVQVISILGEPFNQYTDDSVHFLYTKPRSSLSNIIGWESIRVTFNKKGFVIGVGSDIFFN